MILLIQIFDSRHIIGDSPVGFRFLQTLESPQGCFSLAKSYILFRHGVLEQAELFFPGPLQIKEHGQRCGYAPADGPRQPDAGGAESGGQRKGENYP